MHVQHACCFLACSWGHLNIHEPRCTKSIYSMISGIIRAGTTASSASIRATNFMTTSGTSSTLNYTEPSTSTSCMTTSSPRSSSSYDIYEKRRQPHTGWCGSSSTSPTARHQHHRRSEGRLHVTYYITPAAISPTYHRQGLHQRGLHRQSRQHTAAAATLSTWMDTHPLTVLLQGDTRHRRRH